ncbi:MAG: 50S ribosomal protein L19e [archaeon]|mgnify:CR=1 FL=1
MNPRKLKRMAAEILQVGETKIWVDPTQIVKAAEAMTRDDVRGLIAQRIIRKRKDQGHSRGAARILQAKKRLGRKTGKGKRTGTKKARSKPREQWISRVRALRTTLRTLKKEGTVTTAYRALYRQVKGNYFRGKKHLQQSVQGETK